MHFDGSKVENGTPNSGDSASYDYYFGRNISAHGDAVKAFGNYVFVTWYRGGKSDRHMMLSRYNIVTETIATIEFPHQHTGYLNQYWIGESHNTIAVGISPLDGTIHLLYDMHGYSNFRPSDGSFANDYFRYSYSNKNAATLPDTEFTLDKFVLDNGVAGDYKHLRTPGNIAQSEFLKLTYPRFFLNDQGDLLFFMREGASSNGMYKFSKYDANTGTWQNFTDFNRLNASSQAGIQYNWGLYGDIKYINGKIRIGFQRRSSNNNDKYQYQNGVYYAYSDDPTGATQWKNHQGELISLPLLDADDIKVMEPGDYVTTTQTSKVYIVGNFDWTVTANEDIHIISRVKDNENNVTKFLHTYKPSGASEFITSEDFTGGSALYTSGNSVYLIGLNNGRVFVEKAEGGSNNFQKVYEAINGRTFDHGVVHVYNGKAYYYLMENSSGNAQPLYLQIIDLGVSVATPEQINSTQTGNWNDGTTWDGGVVPTSSDAVVIKAGHKVDVAQNQMAAASSLTAESSGAELRIKENARLTVTGAFTISRSENGVRFFGEEGTGKTGTITYGSVTPNKKVVVSKRLTSGKWFLISFPHNNAVVNHSTEKFTFPGTRNANYNLVVNGTPSISLASYNDGAAAGSKYTYYPEFVANTEKFTNGAGYSTRVDHATTPDMYTRGFLHNGANVTIQLSTGGNGFNLLGNPYISYLHANTAASSGQVGHDGATPAQNVLDVNGSTGTDILAEDTIWLWDGDNDTWITKTRTDAIGYRINPLQGFFVKAKTVADFTFTRATMQSHDESTGGAFLKSANERFVIDLMIASDKSKRNTSIRYADNSTLSFDNGADASVFGGYASDFEVYTQLLESSTTKKLAIQSLPNKDYESQVIPVGVKVNEETDYTFSLYVSNLPKGYKVFLEDRLTNAFTRLDEAGSEYTATLSEATEGRFFIHTKASVLSAESQILSGVSVFNNGSTLHVVGLAQGAATVNLYNMLGKEVYQHSFVAKSVDNIDLPRLAKGVYIVKLHTTKGSLSKKIILN